MSRFLILIFILPIVLSCSEPISFDVSDESTLVVIEGFISDMSYDDAQNSGLTGGRYFGVEMQYSRPIHDYVDAPITGASVTLEIMGESALDYTEIGKGKYLLMYDDFAAVRGKQYRLSVVTLEDRRYYSDWEQMPTTVSGDYEISSERAINQRYSYPLGERQIESVEVQRYYANFQANEGEVYFKWGFDGGWIFKAPRAVSEAVETCWVSSNLFLPDFILKHHTGGQESNLLFDIELAGNDKLLYDMTVLLKRQAISEDHFYYFEELAEQSNRGSIFDAPPFNVRTNIRSESGDEVAGYFGVVSEDYQRIWLNHDDLGYTDPNPFYQICEPGPGPMPQQCLDCRRFTQGASRNVKPHWWR